MKMSIMARILLLATGLLAAYMVAVGIEGFSTVSILAYTVAFGVLLVAGLLLLILGFEVLDSPLVVIVSTIIPLALALGLIWQYFPAWQMPYLVFVSLGFLAVVITRAVRLRSKLPTLVLALVLFRRRDWRKVLAAAAMPVLVVVFWYGKNLVQVGIGRRNVRRIHLIQHVTDPVFDHTLIRGSSKRRQERIDVPLFRHFHRHRRMRQHEGVEIDHHGNLDILQFSQPVRLDDGVEYLLTVGAVELYPSCVALKH